MSECLVHIGVEVTGLGGAIEKRIRFTTTAPAALASGYGTIAAASTYEAIPMGQVAASLIYGTYIRAIDNSIRIAVASVATAAQSMQIASGEAVFIRPSVSTGAVCSVMLICSTAAANYEYLVVGATS